MSLIHANNLWVKYRGSKDYALRGINLQVDEGEIIGIIGPTGAGKTTLCKCLTGIVPQMGAYDDFKGDVLLNGLNTREHKVGEISQKCGMVFQDYETQLFRTSVALEVAFGPENRRLSNPEIISRIAESLRATHLTGLEERYTSSLSGGQKQRLAIASILSLLPEVLILDEATSDLDPVGKYEVYKVIRGLIAAGNVKALVLVDHHLDRIVEFATRVIVLKEGQIVTEGTPRSIFSNIDLLESNKLAPIQTAKIFHELNITLKEKPMTVEEAVESFPRPAVFNHPSPVMPPSTEDLPAIELRDVWFYYDPGQWVIRGVNLTVRKGESFGLIGQNGSGKTTLAHLIMGIVLSKKGEIRIFGKDVTREGVTLRGRHIGYVFQNPDYQIFSPTVRDELAYGPRHAALPKDEVSSRVTHTAKLLGIENILDEDPFFLSKADRQRVAVGSVLTLNPKIVILDEPTTGLSPGETSALMDLARELNTAGTTLIVISHDMWVIAKYCPRTVLIGEGEILLDGPTREVFSNEEVLSKNFIQPPQVVELSKRLFGTAYLTVEEFVQNVSTVKKIA